VAVPEQIVNVAVKLKANVYFDGKVVSHSLVFPEGQRKTVGVIYPGKYHFKTDGPEKMEILAGRCRVKVAGEKTERTVSAGESFRVPGQSAFDIAVDENLAEYLCSFE